MSPTPDPVRLELAAAAARLIAEEGCDYSQAKRRAVRALFGDAGPAPLPDNAEIERELRRYLALFAADTHPPLLAALRRIAAAVMEQLAPFNPYLVGAVLNGTATEHSNIELQLFTDSAKDVEMALLNAGIDFDAEAADDAERTQAHERLIFLWPAREPGLPPSLRQIGICLSVYETDAVRVAPRYRGTDGEEFGLHPIATGGRADRTALRQLIAES
ncbi:MAG TPA: hypothetical protein VMK32_00285 [Burkholderiaceae bacterium]|nr:hypothetical protein [Burkholderiaceae bacterium]